jgi:ligand-binding sensor domain-containing protein
MNRKFRPLFVLLILALLVAACGGKESPTDTPKPTKTPVPPTDTPIPPTATPVPTDTPVSTSTPIPTDTPIPALELGSKAFRNDLGGYALNYPAGWQVLDFENMTIVYENEADLQAAVPAAPIMLLEGGPLEILSDGEMAGAQSAREMIEAVAVAKEGDQVDFEMSEVQEITVAGGKGAMVDIAWTEEGTPVAGRAVTIHMGNWGVFIQSASVTGDWEPFVPTFDAMMESLSLFEPEIAAGPSPISQWASSANASSQYSDPNWAASQASGEPDTSMCGDNSTAWASASSSAVDWLELTYDVPVQPTEVNILQSYNPDQVTLVELLDIEGNYHEVYSGQPDSQDECPYTLSIAIEADYYALGVRITLDQTVLASWNEIDAVELIGVPGDEMVVEQPPSGGGVTLQPPAPLPPVDAPSDVELVSGLYHYTNGNQVREIALHDGVLWAATGGGVVAWDLSSGAATKYTTLDGLPTNNLEAVAVCPIPEPRIIFGSEYGLSLYDPASGTWEHMDSANSGMERDGVDTLDCDPASNTLLVGYDPFGLDVYDSANDAWTFYDDDAGLASGFVSQAAVIGDEIWVVAAFGVSVIAPDGSITAYDEELGNIPDENVSGVAADAAGNVWLAGFDGLLKYSNGTFTLYNRDNVDEFPFLSSFERVQVASDGTVWAGNYFGTICQFDPASEQCIEIYEDEDGMVSGLDDMFMDDQDNVYYCDDGEGISVFDGSAWTMLVMDELPLSNRYRALAQMQDGYILAGGDFGLQQFPAYDADAAWETVDLEGNSVNTFYPTAEGMWIGHSAGASFYEYASEKWTHFKRAEEAGQGIYDGSVTAIAIDGAGRIWFGTYGGLTVWDGENYDYYDLLSEEEIAEERSPRQVNALFFDGSNVWVGSYGAFFRFDADGEITRWDDELEGLLATFFAPSTNAFAQDLEGNVLLAVDRRLLSYDGESFEELYEAESYIKYILTNDEGGVMLSLNYDGIVISDGDEWITLQASDGLASNHYSGQTVLLDYLGTIWFASEDAGLVRLVP